MPAIDALRTALSTIGNNPVLFLGGFLLGALTLPQSVAGLAGVPVVPTVLQVLTFFVTPFLVAGIVGMADEGRTGRTGVGTLTAVGRERYLPLLLANLLRAAIDFAVGILVVLVAIVAVLVVVGPGALAGGFDPAAVAPASLAVGGLLVGLVVLLAIVVAFLLQFYDVSVVVEGAGPVDGFVRSYRVVRANLLSTLGYSVVTVVAGVVASLPVTGFVLFRTVSNLDAIARTVEEGAPAGGAAPQVTSTLFSTTELLAIAAISLFLSTVLVTFTRTYAVTFFRRHAPDAGDVQGGTETDDDYQFSPDEFE